MGIDFKVVAAIFRKDMRLYLGNPTGYVFLTLFIGATAAAAFLSEDFFARNLADLAALNRWMPILLMMFVPAITMNAWAEERRSGTDELLLTLPVRDTEVVLGKYLGVLGMFTLSLGFSLAHLVVLAVLGDPDAGLAFSTYAGYWLTGALFAAIGLLGSMFTMNTTVAFILGIGGCAALVIGDDTPWASAMVGILLVAGLAALAWVALRSPKGAGIVALVGAALAIVAWRLSETKLEGEIEPSNRFEELFSVLSAERHFASFGEGVIRLGDVAFFVSGVVVILYLCGFLLGRRHW
jgi:hypothetical protein